MSYSKVTDAIQDHGLSWNEIDRILLNEDAYEEFHEQYDAETTNWKTVNAPAIRETTEQEKIVYVDSSGYLQEIEL